MDRETSPWRRRAELIDDADRSVAAMALNRFMASVGIARFEAVLPVPGTYPGTYSRLISAIDRDMEKVSLDSGETDYLLDLVHRADVARFASGQIQWCGGAPVTTLTYSGSRIVFVEIDPHFDGETMLDEICSKLRAAMRTPVARETT